MKTVEELKAEADAERARVKNLVLEVALFYHEHVCKLRLNRGVPYVSPVAKRLIEARLAECGIGDLKEAMKRFSADDWQRANNAVRGLEWFFNSYARVDKWLRSVPMGATGRDLLLRSTHRVELSEGGIKKLDEIRSKMGFK